MRTDTGGAEGLTQTTTAHSSPAVRELDSGQAAQKTESVSIAANGNPGTTASERVSLHTSMAADASEKRPVEKRSGTSNDAGKLWSLVVEGTERFANTRTGPVPQRESVITGQPVVPALVLEPEFASVEMTTAIDEMAVAGGEQVGTSRGTTPANITTLPQQDGTAQFARISQQLMEVAVRHSDGPVELMLSPEELGRVRMNFLLQDGALTVTVTAERGETLALIRRNIDILLQDFQDVGLSGVNLEFVEQDPGGQQDGFSDARGETPDNQSDALPVADTEKQSPVRINAMTGARTGLDLRL
ncbi:flagellar hook-length control protein FliK [Halocynthiibacter styelae]|uniref:Flagellar hook-length control protein FliK n=1 Tax=Halocynthiibacter styelae TaxID=2761955 RepID=A0A8J7J8F3_9RHOB|nr:flagellar hook-length control protein FliK [Paenihalocynthiibacter styelae]MBI1495285.1 flagellar hook-length control protein FliK [Paenihalocynthiibacter styelae]